MYILGFYLVCVFYWKEPSKAGKKKKMQGSLLPQRVVAERLVCFTCIHLPLYELALSTWDESSNTAMSHFLFLLIIINIMFQTEENDNKIIF